MGEISKQQEIAMMIHKVTYKWQRLVSLKEQKLDLDQDTITNGRILGYLNHFRDRDIYQKDLEKQVGLTKSSISAILSGMERKGYLERQSVKSDARLKKVVITEEGIRVSQKLHSTIEEVDRNFTRGIAEEEQAELLRLLQIVNQNMREMEAEMK